MTNVAGVFFNKIQADNALSGLLEAGFKKEDISLLVSDHARHTIFPAPVDNEGERATRGGAVGALWGGAIGVLLVGLTTVATIAIPGSGLLATGPIISMLAGAGAGTVVGGLGGALISAGFAVDEANRYEKEVKAGKAIVIVHAASEDADKARAILANMDGEVKVA